MKNGILGIAGLFLVASAALAQDIVPWPHRHDLQPINLTSQRMEVKIKDQVAQVGIDATFHNPNQAVVEGMYFSSLPAGAQITDLTMIVNGKETKAELLDSKKAREIYNQIVNARRDPAILELVGHQMIKLSIFPINPNSDVQIKIAYTQMLEKDGGFVKFQAPFAHNTSNDRGVDSAVLNVTIESQSPLKSVYSPSHNVDVAKRDDHNARVSYEAKNYASRKDFQLYYSTSDQDVGLNLLTYREAGEDGFFVLLASPRVQVDPGKILPKDIVFVYDRSGSMSGEKMRQGQEALQFCLDNLNPADRFTIVDFATEAATFESKLVEASKDRIERAKKYVLGMRAAGSTNIDEALQTAVAMFENDPKRVRMVFFMTDGLPTVGEQNMDRILGNVSKKNESAALCRVFVFGVGLDVNTLFLDKLAELNRGAREYVQPEEKIEGKVSGLYSKVSNPVLSGLAVDFGSVRTAEVYPRTMPDLFQGSQLVVLGRYSATGSTVITLKGSAAGEEKLFKYEVNFPEKDASHDFLPRLWAGRKVAYLVDAIRLSGRQDKEVVEEIVALGKKYGIVTPFTSFLITEENAQQFGRRMRDELDRGHKLATASGAGSKEDSKKAQEESKGLDKAKDAPSAEGYEADAEKTLKEARKGGRPTSVEEIRFVGTKVFYLKNRIWMDGAFDAEKMKDKAKKIVFLSEEYLKLLDDHDGIQKYLAVGERLVLVWGEEVFQIEPAEK